MTTDTEALRAQFERRMNQRGWSEANMRRDGLDYSSEKITEAWHAFQAGHAAAKAETAATAETAAAVAGRWYFVTNDGAATLCVDEADARGSAAEADIAFPRMAPHRAVQLVPADRIAALAKDAEDARRLDWLTFNISGKALRDIGVIWSEHGDARRAIDAARTQQDAGWPTL